MPTPPRPPLGCVVVSNTRYEHEIRTRDTSQRSSSAPAQDRKRDAQTRCAHKGATTAASLLGASRTGCSTGCHGSFLKIRLARGLVCIKSRHRIVCIRHVQEAYISVLLLLLLLLPLLAVAVLVVACPLPAMPPLASMGGQEGGVAFRSQGLRDAKSGPGRRISVQHTRHPSRRVCERVLHQVCQS